MPMKSPWGSGWGALAALAAALSIVYLIEDFGFIKLFGALKKWIDAWHQFVRVITNTLFGWANWRWISVTNEEGHVLLLSTIFSSAVVRAATEEWLQRVILSFFGLASATTKGVLSTR